MVFEYSYSVGTGERSRNHRQTVFAFQTPHLQLPAFALYPETMLSMVGELVGFNDIDFESHPKFSESFKLSGGDEAQIRNLFQPQVLTFFENMNGVRVDGGGNHLFFYRTNRLIPVDGLDASFDEAKKVYDLFRR